MDALEAGPFTICFCNIKPPVYFALRRVVLRSGKRLWFFRVNTARDLAPERSTFSMLQLHLFWGPSLLYIRQTAAQTWQDPAAADSSTLSAGRPRRLFPNTVLVVEDEKPVPFWRQAGMGRRVLMLFVLILGSSVP